MKKKKKIPLFWKIYIFAVTLIVLICCGFFVILSVNLRHYEQAQTQERSEARREAEISAELAAKAAAQSEYEARDSAELAGAGIPSARDALLAAEEEARAAAHGFVSTSLDSTPEKVMDALMAELRDKGAAAVRGILSLNVGKYESEQNALSYIDSAPGEYAYEKSGDSVYRVKKGSLNGEAVLKTEKRADGRKIYSVELLRFDLPYTDFRFQTPENAVITVNGKKVDETPSITDVALPDFVPAALSVPGAAYYELGGFIKMPAVSAVIDGKECVRINYPDKTVFLTPSDAEYKETLIPVLSNLSFSYSDFVAGVYGFSTLKQYLWKGTKLYDALSVFDNRWYYNYDHIGNLNVKVTDFTVYSEDLVSAHIEYTQTLYDKNDKVRFRIPIKLDVFMGRTGGADGKWLLVNVE